MSLESRKLIETLGPIKEFVHTMTADNGKEFAYHQMVGIKLEEGFYFAKPYHSWERGLNEHTNGLIRQYFPKTKSFSDITDEEVKEVETSLEVFDRLAKDVVKSHAH